ncbi:MAG: phosphoethanolamine transferase domain-containing protein [Patiriisocius sp.]|jgi:hypothetical protein|tara:strand:+ start:1283 stop:1774 length:492 start_codon:yes stop_codon:yes gene_type:complete
MSKAFKETQKFSQWWLWLILLFIGALPILGIYKQLIIGEKFGDKPMSDLGLIIFAVFVFSLIAMFWFMQLKTEIDQNEIRMRFFPLVKKRVSWEEIKNAEIVNYGFVGGWGIRLSTKYGTVYNMKGDKGLAIELLNGKNFLIGTQKPNELTAMLEKISAKNTK